MAIKRGSRVIEIGEWQPLEESFASHRQALKERLEKFENASKSVCDSIDGLSFRIDKLEQIVYLLLDEHGLYAKHEAEDPYVGGRTKMSLVERSERESN